MFSVKASPKGNGKTRLSRAAIFLLLGLVCAAPRPAYATLPVVDYLAVSWLTAISFTLKGYLGNFNAYVSGLTGQLTKINEDLKGAIAANGAGQSMGQAIQMRAAESMAQAQVDNVVQTAREAEAAAIVGRHTTPSNQQLCNNVVARQGQLLMRWWAGLLGDSLNREIDGRYLGNTSGNGPVYALDALNLRCPDKDDKVHKNDPKFGNKASKWGDLDCVDSDPDFADLDISAVILSGMEVLELPPTTKMLDPNTQKEYNVRVIEEGNRAQKMFAAAVQYCYNRAGPRPTPANGKEVLAASVLSKTVNWQQCAALQSQMTSACTKRVAKLTRPACKSGKVDDSTDKVCAASALTCSAAKKAGVSMPPNFSCEAGLSLFQAQEVSHMICFASQHTAENAAAGAGHDKLASDNTECQKGLDAWETLEATEKGNLIQSAIGLADKSCWSGADNR